MLAVTDNWDKGDKGISGIYAVLFGDNVIGFGNTFVGIFGEYRGKAWHGFNVLFVIDGITSDINVVPLEYVPLYGYSSKLTLKTKKYLISL